MDPQLKWFNLVSPTPCYFSPSGNTMIFSPSGWCFLQVQAQGMYLSLACSRPRDPYSCYLAYGTALFGPFECKQSLMDVSCVSVHSTCISSHVVSVNTLSFSKITARSVQHIWVALDFPTKMFTGCWMYFAIFLQWLVTEKFESKVQLVGFVFGILLCTTEASNVQANLPLFPHWFGSICRSENRLWGRWSLDIFDGFCIWGPEDA